MKPFLVANVQTFYSALTNIKSASHTRLSDFLLKKSSLIILVLLSLFCSLSAYSQSGGRRKEKKAKTKGNLVLKRPNSKGHADEFARGNSGRKGLFARLFKKEKPAWQYKSSGSRRNQYKANRYLFKRDRSEGHIDNEETLKRQNKKRSKSRDRGNQSFKNKKY